MIIWAFLQIMICCIQVASIDFEIEQVEELNTLTLSQLSRVKIVYLRSYWCIAIAEFLSLLKICLSWLIVRCSICKQILLRMIILDIKLPNMSIVVITFVSKILLLRYLLSLLLVTKLL